MTLPTRIGAYPIERELGRGGMGVVYLGRDPRLDRPVAIKVLPDEFARDPERLARFEREARLLAQLKHPNIAGIYGIESDGAQRFLVLEYVEGETLTERLARGRLRLGDTLDICRQIAAALESAHESGIIHRDLKPGNVKITPAGEVKVLDFGLAKGAAGDPSSGPALTQSPTMSLAMTGAGVILGTAAYMSPEQARGKPVDRRTDIWSFGCVLYECLAGRQVFEGETVSDMIARILEREPDWNALPADAGQPLRDLLARCLEKDARQRLRDIGDARLELERLLAARRSESTLGPRGARAGADARGGRAWAIAALVAGLILGAAGGTVIARRLGAGHGGSAATHLSVGFPDGMKVRQFALSPAGDRVVCVVFPAGATPGPQAARLAVRRLDRFEADMIAGTDGVGGFRLTPDGRTIVFRAPRPGGGSELLLRVPTDGSAPPVVITEWQDAWRTMAPLGNGEVLVLDEPGEQLFRIPVTGGTPSVVRLERGSYRGGVRLGDVLPGDQAVLVTLLAYRDRGYAVQVGVIDLRTGTLHVLIENGGNPALGPDGQLLFSRGDVLLSVAFDPRGLAVHGAPVAVESGLRAQMNYVPGEFAIARNGDLVTVPGGIVGDERRLGLVDADGRLTAFAGEGRAINGWPEPSFDNHTVVTKITSGEAMDELWTTGLEHPALRRAIALPTADCDDGVLSPDGRWVVYTRLARDAEDGLYVADLHGVGSGRRIVTPESSAVRVSPGCWSPDGRLLVIHHGRPRGNQDLWVVRFGPQPDSVVSVRPLLATPYSEEAAEISPDGRWITFQSDESGRREVYVAAFSSDGTMGRPTRVTEQGRTIPEWRANGRQLTYRDLDNDQVFIRDLTADPRVPAGPERPWFSTRALRVADFSVLRDGRAIVVIRGPLEREDYPSLDIVLGWGDELKRKLASGAAH